MKTPKGLEVDHINGNRLDNRRCNLRLVTRQQNRWNSSKQCINTSGYKGVTFCKQTGKWQARIRANGKKLGLGRYSTPKEAAIAYNKAAIKYYGEFAKLNKI